MRDTVRIVPCMLLIASGCNGGGSPFANVDAGDGGSAQGSGQSDAGTQPGTGGRAGSSGTGGRSPGTGGAGGRGGAGGAGAGGMGGGAGGSGGSMSSDPCATDNGGCDPLVTCSASGSSITCGACPSGYDDANGNGKRCTDIDECATNNGDCGSATYYSCTNNVGAPPTCADIDECATDNGGCGSATYWTCANNAGAAPTCTDIDECQTNNGGCGDAAYWHCGNNAGAAPSCTCNPGYTSVNGACACDLNGTFAMQVTTTESWTGIQYIENASQVVSKSWSMRLQSYDATGKLAVSTEPCGGTSPDLCGTGISAVGVPAEAYAAFFSNSIWRGASMPVWTFEDPSGFSITNALPGQPYVEPRTAALLGISLTDPFGQWPASRANVSGGGGTQTNGAAWVDADSDGRSGVMNYDVPPGGVLSASAPFPPQDYGATSTDCPRSSAGTRRSYAYVPAYDGGVVRVKRFSNAARVISQLSGTIGSTCDTITGNVIGPQGGQQQVDGRVYDCVIVSGSGEAACSAAVVNALDAPAGGTHTFNSVTFIVKRVAAGTTCDQIRAMSF